MFQLFSHNYWQEKGIPFHLEYRDPQLPFPIHSHNFHEIVYVVSGEGTHITTTANHTLKKGDIANIKPGQAHGFKKINNLQLINILIFPQFLNEELSQLSSSISYKALFEENSTTKITTSDITHFNLSQINSIEAQSLLDSMQQEFKNKELGYQVHATSYLIQFIILLMRAYEEKEQRILTPDASIVHYVEKHFREEISLKELIQKSGMSDSSLLRAFKRLTGEPPLAYQNKLRMIAAASDLSQTKKNITQVALDAGFNDSNYFCRVFKKFYNVTPLEYRNKSQLTHAQE